MVSRQEHPHASGDTDEGNFDNASEDYQTNDNKYHDVGKMKKAF